MENNEKEQQHQSDKEVQINRGLGALLNRMGASRGGGAQHKPPPPHPVAQVSKQETEVHGFDINSEGFSGWDDLSTQNYNSNSSGQPQKSPDNRDGRPPGGKRGTPLKGREDTNKKQRFNYDEDVYGPQDITDWSEVAEFNSDGNDNLIRVENERLAKKFGEGVTKVTSGDKYGRLKYYCKICLVELNSESTLDLHCEGMKHLKKKNILDKSKGLSNTDFQNEEQAPARQGQGGLEGRGGRDEWEGGRGKGGWEGRRGRGGWEGGRGRGGWEGGKGRGGWEGGKGEDEWEGGKGGDEWEGRKGGDEWEGRRGSVGWEGGRIRGAWEGRSGLDDRYPARGWDRKEMVDEDSCRDWDGRGGGRRDWDNRLQDSGNSSRGDVRRNDHYDWPPQGNRSRYDRPQEDYSRRDVEGRRTSPYGDRDRYYSKGGPTPSDRYTSELYRLPDQFGPPPAPSLRPPTPPPAPSISETSESTTTEPINLLLKQVATVSVQTDKDAEFAIEVVDMFVKSLKDYNQKKGLANSVNLLDDITEKVGIMQSLEKESTRHLEYAIL
ncbi:hypothetical protein Pcinc_017064 [Petrolisthes cinctipes]|uniref:C2H2-type domain-containing protein n=1 Tax=Petrolisthes cinctipes TaxID=88211 RepID=A0AAE1FR33_PETCI|nr:hypothetical protein Pcinc_029971 [Petrolisthes cinctipes]KAK3878306.1 hypothetical protein Pcinc_017064 [Petrolisthes cinctipes]